MKTKLLFTLLLVTTLGYAQTFNNTAGYYINELLASVSGTDTGFEYIELRGPAGAILPSGTYLITIEGDGEDSDVGEVEEILDLSNLSFGANGYLSIVYKDAAGANHTTYDALLSVSDATVYNETDIAGYDGDLLDYSATYLLISSPTAPIKGVSVDSSPLDGNFDATGDHTLWNIYDSVSSLDNDGSGGTGSEYGYGQINIVTNYTTSLTEDVVFYIPTGSTVISIDDDATDPGNISTSNVYYIARQGVSAGYNAVSDWMAGQTNSNTSPNWGFTGRTPKLSPNSLASTSLLDSTFGGANLDPIDDAPLSTSDVLDSKFKIFPNPAKDYISIDSNNVKFSSVEMYSLIGKKVISVNNLVNSRLNISSLSTGVYLLKINAEGRSLNKRIVVQ